MHLVLKFTVSSFLIGKKDKFRNSFPKYIIRKKKSPTIDET